MHHPLMSNGSHGGQFSIEKQIFPLAKNSLTSYWLIYKPTKKNDSQSSRYPKQTIHCLCKTHQNSFTKPQRDSSIRP
jgi:hypothetical protein